jgi:tripartite-type tricarboxylate transporter receptor subunit TctC
VKSDRLRVLAVTTANRAPLLPAVPTIAQSGFPGYEVSGWYGLLAPAGTPAEIVTKLQQEVARILELPDVKELQAANGRIPTPGGNTPQAFAANIRKEIARWAQVIKRAGIRLE